MSAKSAKETPWFEVFKTGKHVDRDGKEENFSEADLDQLVKNYEIGEHAAPIWAGKKAPNILGHILPKENAPRYGVVSSLKREGDKLLAKIKDYPSEFADWLNQKLYHERSIAIVKDPERGWLLEHLGWLGAVPPAIKGLADPNFEFSFDNDSTVHCFFQQQEKTMKEESKDFDNNFEKRFQEQEKRIEALNKAILAREAEIKEERTKRIRSEFSAFVDSLSSSENPRILPKEKSDIVDFLMIFSSINSYAFSSSGTTKSPVVKFQEFLQGLPNRLHFKEIATKQEAEEEIPELPKDEEFKGTVNPELAVLDRKAFAFSKKHNISYLAALKIIRSGQTSLYEKGNK
jgi:hypothetical protein